MINMKRCEKCGYRHRRGRCCIDIYQQLGKIKGPSIVWKVLLAFGMPIIVFIAGLVLAEHFVFACMDDNGLKTFVTFLTSTILTILIIQLIRIITRKPVI